MELKVPMPSLGPDMQEGKLMKWLVHPHEKVKKGDALAVIETTKSTIEIESFHSGVVERLIRDEGSVVHVGEEILLLELDKTEERTMDKKVETEGVPLSKNREMVSMLMSRSKKEIPHFYLKHQIKLGTLISWLDEKNKHLPPEERLLLPIVFFKATLLALKEVEDLNCTFEDGKLKRFDSVNLSIVLLDKEKTTLAPTIMNAEKLNLRDLQQKVLDLDERARSGRIHNTELFNGTFTITNLGERGVDEVYGVIFPPQVAILGIGRPHEVNASFVCDFTLSADHRITDGLYGAKFLRKIDSFLQTPKIFEEML